MPNRHLYSYRPPIPSRLRVGPATYRYVPQPHPYPLSAHRSGLRLPAQPPVKTHCTAAFPILNTEGHSPPRYRYPLSCPLWHVHFPIRVLLHTCTPARHAPAMHASGNSLVWPSCAVLLGLTMVMATQCTVGSVTVPCGTGRCVCRCVWVWAYMRGSGRISNKPSSPRHHHPQITNSASTAHA